MPEFVWMDTTHNILIMEDVCNCPDLAECQCHGKHAGEWIQFFTLAIKLKLPIQGLDNLIFIYTTFSKIIKKGITRYLRTQENH